MRTKRELRAAVKRGIALLNARTPFWRRVIRVREMKFDDPCCCVLGTIGSTQVCGKSSGGNWERGKVALGIDDVDTYTAGPKYCGFDWMERAEAPTLKRLWLQAIRTGRV